MPTDTTASAAASAAGAGGSSAFMVMNGSAACPQLDSFAAYSTERQARLLSAMQHKPHAVSAVLKHQLDAIKHHAEQGIRCFTYGVVDEHERVVEANTYKRELLPWINGGALMKDHAFVHYINSYDPSTQHPIYVTAGKHGGFLCAVVAIPDSTHAMLARLLQQGPVQMSPEATKSMKEACMNTRCNARDQALHRCSRCLKATYCSKECQKKDWPVHKLYCGK